MAVFKKGILGGFSGRIGPVVAYHSMGQDTLRSRPKKRTKKAGQKEQANRQRFGQMQAWLKPLLGFLRVGFKNYAPTFQGFVAAKSYNSKNAFVEKEDGTWFIDPKLVRVSHGIIALPKTTAMVRSADEIVVTWSKEGHYQNIDQAMILAYAPTKSDAFYDLAIAKRKDGRATVALSDLNKKTGIEFHFYLAFVTYDHTAQSNSQYLGSITT